MTTVELCTSPAAFVDAQRAFYVGDPHFVPPMTWFDKKQVDRARHPFYRHADTELWLARDKGRLVGRISATRDRLHDEFHGDRVGFFGHFEAADEDAAHALLTRSAEWLAARGATVLRGPVDLSTNYRCGLLVEGQPGPPFMMMPHNPPSYAGWLASFGLTKAHDLLALLMLGERLRMKRVERIAARAAERTDVVMRLLDPRRFDAELTLLWALYTSAWERNWGFVPMTEAEFRAEAEGLRQVVNPQLTCIASIDGEVAGMAIGVPDVNAAIKACDGRLLPFGWWRFRRVLRHVRAFRVLTLGVSARHRNTGLDAMLLAEIVRNGLAHGYYTCEASWVLEDNAGMLRPLEAMGGTVYRRYRIYERALAGA